MKIVIDARFLGPEGTGIGKYTGKLIENLQKLDSENEYFVILRKENWNLFNPGVDNFKKVLVNASWYGVKEQLLIPAALRKIKPDLVHFPHFTITLLYPVSSSLQSTMSLKANLKVHRQRLGFYQFII